MTQKSYSVEVIKPGLLIRDRFGNILDARSNVTLIQGEDSNIIVDTGLSSERQEVLDGLGRFGLTPKDINILIITHSHIDHIGNNELFKNAQYIIHKKEYLSSKIQNNIQLIENTTELMPGLRLIETPGHTEGSITVIVEGQIFDLNIQPIAITGDALPIRDNYLKWVPPGINFNPGIALQSMEKIVNQAEIIIPGHDKPFQIIKDKTSKRKAKYL